MKSALVLLLAAAPAAAHDSWLVPRSFAPTAGEPVDVAFVTAELFPVSDHAADPGRVASWTVTTARAAGAVEGARVEGLELVATTPALPEGATVHGLALAERFIEIEPDDFEAYLEDEEARDALAFWRATARRPGREMYTKHAKTFTRSGEGAGGFERVLGHRLEIVPVVDPLARTVGDELEVRVLFEGQPAVGVRVAAGHEGLPPHTYVATARTDASGRATIALDAPGLWFLRAHVIRTRVDAVGERAEDADWESFWASMTFPVAAPEEHADAAELLQRARAAHAGHAAKDFGGVPFAVLGLRAGEAALAALELPRGAPDLKIEVGGPPEAPFEHCLADGLIAATGATDVVLGPKTPLAREQSVVRDVASGRTATITWRAEAVDDLSGPPASDLGRVSWRAATAPAEELFSVTTTP